MTMLVHAPRSDDSVIRAENPILDGTRMLCQMLWQGASERMRLQYPAYGLKHPAFKARVRSYKEKNVLTNLDVMGALSQIMSFKDLLEEPLDTRRAGKMLRQVSFAGCMIGIEPSVGDLDMAVSFFRKQPTVAQSLCEPVDRVSLLIFLNERLEESIANLGRIERDAGSLNRTKQIFYHASSDGVLAIDYAVVGTFFTLHRSLLSLVEPVSGHA